MLFRRLTWIILTECSWSINNILLLTSGRWNLLAGVWVRRLWSPSAEPAWVQRRPNICGGSRTRRRSLRSTTRWLCAKQTEWDKEAFRTPRDTSTRETWTGVTQWTQGTDPGWRNPGCRGRRPFKVFDGKDKRGGRQFSCSDRFFLISLDEDGR